MNTTYHAYCGGELRVIDGAFQCTGCGVTGRVERAPGEITLADVRVLADRGLGTLVVTDREVQLASYATEDKRLQAMLWELVELRRAARLAVSKHDLYRPHAHHPAIELGMLVGRSGCEWWQCTSRASTQRMVKDRYDESRHLCCAHADEGERKGMWNDAHVTNVQWRADDYSRRTTARKRTLEMIEEDHDTQGAAS